MKEKIESVDKQKDFKDYLEAGKDREGEFRLKKRISLLVIARIFQYSCEQKETLLCHLMLSTDHCCLLCCPSYTACVERPRGAERIRDGAERMGMLRIRKSHQAKGGKRNSSFTVPHRVISWVLEIIRERTQEGVERSTGYSHKTERLQIWSSLQ